MWQREHCAGSVSMVILFDSKSSTAEFYDTSNTAEFYGGGRKGSPKALKPAKYSRKTVESPKIMLKPSQYFLPRLACPLFCALCYRRLPRYHFHDQEHKILLDHYIVRLQL